MSIDLAAASGHVTSRDGTRIGWFREGSPGAVHSARRRVAPPVVLVHGTTADHQTWRVLGPMLALRGPVVSIDRRGRGASSDTEPYAIEREFEDVAAVAAALSAEGGAGGAPVDVIGHSFGGRCALGAATVDPDAIRRIVTYEGAVSAHVGAADLARLEALEAEPRWPQLLEVFLREVVDMTDEEWQRFLDAPVYPARVAAAHTVVRELRAGSEEAAAWSGYGEVSQPVLQILGSESPSFFVAGAEALDRLLPDGGLAVIEGARHAAHHTHPEALFDMIAGFLDEA